jgi:hypothetical protein
MVMLYHRKTIFNPTTRVAVFVLLTVVNFLSARSAFSATIALFLMGLMFNLAPRLWVPIALRVAGLTLIISAGVLFPLWAVGRLPSPDDNETITNFTENILPWAFELFINSKEGDGLTSGTTTAMQEELFFPESVFGLLFGVGDSAPMSDSGLVRTVFAVGIFGLVVHLVLVAGFWRFALSRIQGETERRILSIAATLLLLINFKELTFSNSRGLFGVFVLFFFAFLILRPPQNISKTSARLPNSRGRKSTEAVSFERTGKILGSKSKRAFLSQPQILLK